MINFGKSGGSGSDGGGSGSGWKIGASTSLFKTQKDHHSNKYILTISSTATIRVLEASE